ncbi:MAG: acyl-CoA thioesterase [Allosphingosinicella sp.]|uniref:acyl-CoA thioesterase n=1 Tax=Allosphingosinicella sp. TaxID=2823234 RepID=UPI00393D3333
MADLLALEPDGADRFRSRFNEPNSYAALFGGQLVAQAAAAADATVDGQELHSLHCHFLRAGTPERRLRFEVDRVREGRRFSNRHVRISQNGAMLAAVTCSYRAGLSGFEHQAQAEARLGPEAAIDAGELARSGDPDLLPFMLRFAMPQPIELRMPGEEAFLCPGTQPRRHYWLRVPSLAGVDDARLHRQALAYLSDFLLSGAALVPHTIPLPGPHVFVTSLDHVLWLHRPVRCDDWLLFETDSPSTSGGVALSRGLVYDRAGALVASIAQEAMQLPLEPAA